MSCFKLPQWVIDELERLLRAFFWKGKNSVNGSDCLVAWDYVCRSYEEGGLGIKNLRIQNDCLLTKFVHRFLTQPNSPWARWVVATHLQGKDFGDRPTTQTRVWKQMWGLIDTYRNATCVQLGDGITTSLWKDKWTSDGPLCFQFPALFSHTSRPARIAGGTEFGLSLLTTSPQTGPIKKRKRCFGSWAHVICKTYKVIRGDGV
jgi:hypothetical protein